MKKSYHPVLSDKKYMDILEFLCTLTGPASAGEIGRALGMDVNTVMNHIQSGVDYKWIRPVGTLYEPGPRMAGMYAAYLQGLKDKRAEIDREITKLEV